MKNISRKCFMTSVVCIVLGAILLGAGYATGGLQDIKHQTAPKKVIQTFDHVTALDIDTNFSTITVETGPVKKPTVTYYTHSKFIDPLEIKIENETLHISEKPRDVIITGGIELIGFGLNKSARNHNYRTTTITLPKGTSLKELKGSSMPQATISDLTVQDLEFSGGLTLLNTRIKKGKVFGTFNATDSLLANLELKADYSLSSLTNSSLENGTISLGHGQLTTKNTNLKSVTIQSLSPGGVETEETSLENVTFTVTSEQENEETNDNGAIFTAHALTLKGTNTISGGDIDVDITLTKAKAIAYRARTENGKVSLGSQLTPAKIGKESTSDVISYVAENKAATGNLTVNLNKGDITIK
ncbi:Adhesin AIDA-I [Streptococcus pyogenes]|nr:Adhesin AIDA-I [Streptococcus pyogenes]